MTPMPGRLATMPAYELPTTPCVEPTAADTFDLAREPARGAVVYPALAALPGVEQAGAFLTGRAPAPPVARLTGRRIIDASFGSATYALPATNWLAGTKGVIHTGVLAVLADAALIASVVSVLPARVLCTTAELSMTFLGPAPHIGGEMIACGRVVHADTEMALAEVHVRDACDRLVAHGTSRCSVFAPMDESTQPPPPDARLALCAGVAGTPDPYLRRPPLMVERGLHDRRDGLELLRAEIRGELPPPPIDQLTGLRLAAAEEGRVAFTLPASPWLRNEWGTVYGGILTLLAKSAAAAAVQSTAAAGTSYTALDVKMNFLRAVPADGRNLLATGAVLHRGKRLAVATAEVLHGNDRVAVLTGTTALTPPPRPRLPHTPNVTGSTQAALIPVPERTYSSQAGFDGGPVSRMLSWGEETLRCHVETEEVPRGAAGTRRHVGARGVCVRARGEG